MQKLLVASNKLKVASKMQKLLVASNKLKVASKMQSYFSQVKSKQLLSKSIAQLPALQFTTCDLLLATCDSQLKAKFVKVFKTYDKKQYLLKVSEQNKNLIVV